MTNQSTSIFLKMKMHVHLVNFCLHIKSRTPMHCVSFKKKKKSNKKNVLLVELYILEEISKKINNLKVIKQL